MHSGALWGAGQPGSGCEPGRAQPPGRSGQVPPGAPRPAGGEPSPGLRPQLSLWSFSFPGAVPEFRLGGGMDHHMCRAVAWQVCCVQRDCCLWMCANISKPCFQLTDGRVHDRRRSVGQGKPFFGIYVDLGISGTSLETGKVVFQEHSSRDAKARRRRRALPRISGFGI